jgi:hypothetical protein
VVDVVGDPRGYRRGLRQVLGAVHGQADPAQPPDDVFVRVPGDPVPVGEHLQDTGNAIRFGNRVWPSSCPLTGAPNQEPLEQAGHRGSIPHRSPHHPAGAPTGRPSRSAAGAPGQSWVCRSGAGAAVAPARMT